MYQYQFTNDSIKSCTPKLGRRRDWNSLKHRQQFCCVQEIGSVTVYLSFQNSTSTCMPFVCLLSGILLLHNSSPRNISISKRVQENLFFCLIACSKTGMKYLIFYLFQFQGQLILRSWSQLQRKAEIQQETELFDLPAPGQFLSLLPIHPPYSADCKIAHFYLPKAGIFKIAHQQQYKIDTGFHYA